MPTELQVKPVEIGRSGSHDIRIDWQDKHQSVFPARFLRLKCPCAMCVDELTGEVRLQEASVPEEVHPLSVQISGHYALAINWSDGHRTGIYPFRMLRALCPCCAVTGNSQ